MMMLMPLCLLVYNLGQRQLRISLKTQEATVKSQLKHLQNPLLHLGYFIASGLGWFPDLKQLGYVLKGFIF
jgi:hypothetical protein